MTRYTILLSRTKRTFPRMRVVKRKDSKFIRALFWPLKLFGVKGSEYATTIGSTIYVPDDFDERSATSQYRMLRHEKVHVRQFHMWPIPVRWLWPINHVLMGFCYLFVLPTLLTMRSYFEKQAYTQTLVSMWEDGDLPQHGWPGVATWLAEVFGGSQYLWMSTRGKGHLWALTTLKNIAFGRITSAAEDHIELGGEHNAWY